MNFNKLSIKSCLVFAAAFVCTLNVKGAVLGTVNADQLNVRRAPSQISDNIITQLHNGDEVQILDVDQGYYEILFNDSSVFVKQEFINYNGVEATLEQDTNLRTEPKQEQNILQTVVAGEKIRVLEYGPEYSYVRYNNKEGYMVSDRIVIEEENKKSIQKVMAMKNATIIANNLNVRQQPSTNSQVLTQLNYGTEVDVQQEEGDWLQIKMDDGSVGHISKDFARVSQAIDADNSEQQASTLGMDIANYGVSLLGAPYVYGGTSLTYGIDCSGFTQAVYAKFGISISRTSRTQRFDGVPVAFDDLQPGDLIFYGHNNYISHVSIYIGNGQVVHASDPKYGVKISGAFANSKPVIAAVRIIK